MQHTVTAQGTQLTTITWIQEPKQFPNDLVIMGDPGYLYLHIFMENDPMNNAPWPQPRIKIDLPKGIDFSQAAVTAGTNPSNILIVEPGLTPTGSFNTTTAANATGDALQGTRSLTLQYIANSNTLRLGDSIVIKIRVRALFEANVLNPGAVVVSVSSGTGQSVFGGVTKNCPVNLMRPTLRIRPTPGFSEMVHFDKILDTMLVSVDIDAQQGHTRSAYIAYTYNSNIVYLDSFKIDGKNLPLLTSNSGYGVYHNTRISGTALPGLSTTQITYIRLDQNILGGNITDEPRTLTFRATANRGCNWELTPWIQNPLTPSPSTSYDRWSTNVTTLSLPGVRGAPTFYNQSVTITGTAIGAFNATSNAVIFRTTPRFDMSFPVPDPLLNLRTPADAYHANNFHSFCWDGETPNYATTALWNQNGVPAIAFEFRTQLYYGENLSYCEYFDTTQIYYRVTCPSAIDGTDSLVVPITRLTGKTSTGLPCIDIQNNFPSTNADIVAHYDQILWDKGRYMTMRLPNIGMDNPLPAGAIVELQWVVYGNPNWIKDSYRSRSNFVATNISYNDNAYYWHTPRYENSCGDLYSSGGTVGTRLIKPRFTAPALPRVAVYTQKTFYWSNPTNTGNANTTATNNPTNDPTGPRYSEYFVKMPSWMDLDTINAIDDAFIIRHPDSIIFYPGGSKPQPGSGEFHGIDDDGYKLYSVKYYVNTSGVLDIRMKPGPCPEEAVIIDTLQVWIDFITGSNPKSAGRDDTGDCRARFKKTSKVFTELEFICTPPALVIDTFGVYRITRGLRDSNNDHVPDDGTLALDNEMQHWHFMEGDTGYYFFDGYVGGEPTNRYDKLVLLLKFGTGGSIGATYQYKWGTTGHAVPLWDKGTIEIKRWNDDKTDFTLYTLPLDIPTVTNQDSLIVYYDGGFNDYAPRGGDSCYLKVPFRCRQGNHGDIRGNFYTITYGIRQNDNTQKWVDKYFPDGLYRMVFHDFYLYARTAYTWTPAFTQPCDPQSISEMYTNTYYTGAEPSNWNYEVRYRHKLQKIVIKVPCGYARTNDKIYIRPARWQNATILNAVIPENYALEAIPDLAEEDFLTQDSIFTIDMTKYIDYEFDGSQGYTYDPNTGLLSNGKYTPGDDYGGAYCHIKQLYATPASIRTSLTTTMYYLNSIGEPASTVTGTANAGTNNQTVSTGIMSLNYTGRKLQMELQTKVMMFSQMGFSYLKLTNAHGNLTNHNTWIYVKGNVEDAYLIKQGTTDTIWGQGKDRCWLNVGTMTGGLSIDYNLVYSYKGNDVCDNDTVTVYSVFDSMDEDYNPDINLGIEPVHHCRRGEKKYTVLDLLTARVKVAGYVTPQIDNYRKPGYLHYNEGYAIDYVVNGKVSQGALNDATITFRIPAGQLYVDTVRLGTPDTVAFFASFEYPQGSGFRPIPDAIRAAMAVVLGDVATADEVRTFTIHIKDLLEKEVFMMPGWGWTPMEYKDIARLFNVRIPLIPLCETDLTGIRFRCTFNGSTFCGEACEDDGTVYTTPSILPDIAPEYNFNVTISHVNTSRVYSFEQRRDTLVVTFKKDDGAGNTEVEVDMSNYVLLRVSDNIAIDGEIMCTPFGKVEILDEYANSEGDYFYKLEFPITELNDLLFETPPTDDTTFTYRIPIIFKPDPFFNCSTPRQELECMVISEANFDKDGTDCFENPFNIGSDAMKVLTLNYDPDLYKVCLNMPNPLTFACGGVTPLWFKDTTATAIMLAADNTYVYTPTVYEDTAFYLRIVYDYDGPLEENFGLTYIKVFMHPLVKAQFSLPSLCVGQEVTFSNESTVDGEPSDITNTLKWYWYLNGSTVPFDSVFEPTRVLNADDVVKLKVISINGCEDITTVVAAPYPLPIPTITGSLDTCYEQCIVYKTEKGMEDYIWTVTNGTPQTPLAGRDSVEICWDQQSSPVYGYVGVVYKDGHGCIALPKDDAARIVVRIPPDVPEISGNDTAACLYSEYTYNFVHQDNIDKFYWTVTGGDIVAGGEGFTYTTIKWHTSGLQTITLAIANKAGCEATAAGIMNVNVLDVTRPTIVGDLARCLDSEEIHYTTLAGMNNYYWHISGGTIISGGVTNDATVVWNTPGTGRLAVSYNQTSNGCPAAMVDTLNITLYALPEPTIFDGTLDTCFKQCDTYYTESDMNNYQWVVTNGTISGDDDDDHVTVCWNESYPPNYGYLKVYYTDENTCRSIGEDSIRVTLHPIPATPVITGNDAPCFNSDALYSFTQQAGMTMVDYIWTVTGGEIISGGNGTDSVRVKWIEADAQTITLTVVSNYGCVPDVAGTFNVTVQPQIKPKFSATEVCIGDATVFTDLSKIGDDFADNTNTSSDPDQRWRWYADGSTVAFDSIQNPSYTFATSGNHDVKLQVTSSSECVHDTTIQILVRALPVPVIIGSPEECLDRCVAYSTESGMTDYIWDVFFGSIRIPSVTETVEICWDEDYTDDQGKVFVTYTDTYGCTGTDSIVDIQVYDLPPTPVITGNATPCVETDEALAPPLIA